MEQIERAERYLARLQYAYQGIQEPSAIFDIENPRDDCISFFMHCYHIKDWIKELYCKGAHEAQDVEDFINEHIELRICADICNLSKHYELKSAYRSGSAQAVEASGHNAMTYMTGSGGLEVHKCEFSITSSNSSYDALQIAERCIELWWGFVDRYAT